MAGYESTQLVESVHEEGVEQGAVQGRRVAPWRRVGLAAAVVATLGAAVGTSLRSTPVTPVQRLNTMRNSLLEAFSNRALEEAADLKTRFNFTFAEEGQEDFSKMSIDAKVETTDVEVDSLTFKLTFAAQEGKGDDLVEQFRKVVSGNRAYCVAEHGEGQCSDLDDMITVEAGEADDVVFAIVVAKQSMYGADEKAMETAMETTPKFTASFKTGRSIMEMYDNAGVNIVMLPHGFTGHVDAAFAHGLLQGVPEKSKLAEILRAIALVDVNHNFRYRAGDDTVEAFNIFPNLTELVQMSALALATGPESIIEPMKGLPDFADGLKSVEISGLPHKYGILVTFNNFHIMPIVKDMIDEAQALIEESGGLANLLLLMR